jgi:hypothetical protein
MVCYALLTTRLRVLKDVQASIPTFLARPSCTHLDPSEGTESYLCLLRTGLCLLVALASTRLRVLKGRSLCTIIQGDHRVALASTCLRVLKEICERTSRQRYGTGGAIVRWTWTGAGARREAKKKPLVLRLSGLSGVYSVIGAE